MAQQMATMSALRKGPQWALPKAMQSGWQSALLTGLLKARL